MAPTIEGLRFAYALQPMRPGRTSLRRWRWELWHGPRLHAAGWRLSERDAQRAVRAHGTRVARSMFGLPALPRTVPGGPGFVPGAVVRVDEAGVRFELVPKLLLEEESTLSAAG
ncbi:MAG: hypothetical protein JHC95_21655 [Solirubrobacteraceae bacterium]|nr:hypothetical protein [Solirubrobacteraceae bacterium]